MKILSAAQIKEADRETIKNEPISSIDLMERAAKECVSWLEYNIEPSSKIIHIFCGMGNNGGDGLAIARFLKYEAYTIKTYLVHFSKNMSDDFITNYERLAEIDTYPENIHSIDDFPLISNDDIVIDAIFGVGLNKPISGFTRNLIDYINNTGAVKYAIDVPSGLYIDKPMLNDTVAIQDAFTLTFQTPKLAFLLPDNQKYVKDFTIIDIGLDKIYLEKLDTNYFYLTKNDLTPYLLKRTKFSHKGTYGHALIIGGSFGKIGAVVLASKAALQVGSGLVTAFVPKCGYQIMQISIPEVMVEVDAENKLEFFNYKTKPTVIGVGIGMGIDEKTSEAFEIFLKNNTLPLVLDADALNIISRNNTLLNFLPEDSILTPHPKELERLIGSWDHDYQKINMIKDFSIKYHCILVVKGAHTLIAHKGNFYFNSSGNPYLATAGSGDVLTGIITGLIAQKYEPLKAAILGVYIHGKTIDRFPVFNRYTPFTASEIIKAIPDIFDYLFSKEPEYGYDESDEDDNLDFLNDMPFDDDFDVPF